MHPAKTKIVHIRGFSETKYPKGYDFLGFTIQPSSYKHPNKEEVKTIPSVFVSRKSKSNILAKFKSLQIHKKRKTLEEVAKDLNPMIRGIINSYHKFRKSNMLEVWWQLNNVPATLILKSLFPNVETLYIFMPFNNQFDK